MTRSLRAKITLALLVTGLTSAVLVGVIARSILLRQFDRVVLENSFRAFQGDLVAYLEAYGSWENGQALEPFADFERRRRGTAPGPPRTSPPFLFMLLDRDGRVLMAPPAETVDAQALAVGEPAPVELRAAAVPIRVGDDVVHAVPLEQPNLSPFDRGYLAAMQNAVAYGVLGAALLGLALGFYFSGRLSANLRTLTRAIQAMGDGQLRQHVEVRSRDEIGFLADAFNRMSAALSEAHQELQRSNDTVRRQAERLKELSIRDDTTHLHNRRYFDEQAGLAFTRAHRYDRPFTVAMADIDHFKQINDCYSHAVGDEVLRRVASILAAGTRESDIVARYGGEEFVIAFPETPLLEAGATCDRIRREIQDYPWESVQPGLALTITIGVDADVSRGSIEKMIDAADARLYEGKQGGRNQVRGAAELAL